MCEEMGFAVNVLVRVGGGLGGRGVNSQRYQKSPEQREKVED